jgi:hypothetical protein
LVGIKGAWRLGLLLDLTPHPHRYILEIRPGQAHNGLGCFGN